MASNTTAQPAQKQTAGMKASAGLAKSKGNIKSYMAARGAKPVSSLGATAGPKQPTKPGGLGTDNGAAGGGGGHPPFVKPPGGGNIIGPGGGNSAKSRRMSGVSQPSQAAARRKGPKSTAAFATQNAVPTGGRTMKPGLVSPGNIKNPTGGVKPPPGNGNPGGVRGAMGRVQDFMNTRPPTTRPPVAGVGGLMDQLKKKQGATPVGHSGAVAKPKQPGLVAGPKPPQGGGPGTPGYMPASAKNGGPVGGNAGGGGTIGGPRNPGATKPKVM